MKKIYVILPILLIFTAIIIVSLNSTSKKINVPSNLSHLTLPQKVGLYIQDSQNKNHIPEIVLTVFAGSGCDEVGELQISEEFEKNQSNIYTKGGYIDMLNINIHGYEFKKASPTSDTGCISVIKEARAKIDLSKYTMKNQLRLNIIINGQTNNFDLNLYEDVLSLNPIESSAVISWNPGENMPTKPQGLGFMTKPFLEQLAKVRLNGSYSHDSDLPAQIRKYFNQPGFEPLDEKLRLSKLNNPLEEFIVYVNDKNEIPESFTLIGKINYHEVLAGEKTIDVGLVKTNLSPLFVRY